jgi:hypothetical protein
MAELDTGGGVASGMIQNVVPFFIVARRIDLNVVSKPVG